MQRFISEYIHHIIIHYREKHKNDISNMKHYVPL